MKHAKTNQPGYIALSGAYIRLGQAKCGAPLDEGVAVESATAGRHMPYMHVRSWFG